MMRGKMNWWIKIYTWMDNLTPMALGELAAAVFIAAILVLSGWKGLLAVLLVIVALALILAAGVKALEEFDKLEE